MATISYVHLDVGNGLTTKNTNGLLKLFIDEDSKLELTSAGLYCPPLGSAPAETGIKKPALSSIGTCMIYAMAIGQGYYLPFDENGSTLNGRYPIRGGNLKFLSMNDKLYDLNFWMKKTGSSCYPFYDSDIIVGELGTQYVQTATSSHYDNIINVTNDYGFTSNTSTASNISSYPDYDRNDRKCMKVTQGFNISNYSSFTYCIWVDESKDVVRTYPSLTQVFHPVYLSPTSTIPVGFLQYDRNAINENYFQPTLYRIDDHKIYYDRICYTDYNDASTTTAEIDFSAMTEDSDYEFIVMEYGDQIRRYFKNIKPGDITAFHVITDLELYEANPPTESTYYVTNPLDENDTTTLPGFNVDFTIDESGTVSSSGTSSASTTSTTTESTTSTASTTSTTTTTSSSVNAITTKCTIDQSTMVDNWTISVIDQSSRDYVDEGFWYGVTFGQYMLLPYEHESGGRLFKYEINLRNGSLAYNSDHMPLIKYEYERELIKMNPKVVEQCFAYSMYKTIRVPANKENDAVLRYTYTGSPTTNDLKTCTDLITEINFPIQYRIFNSIKNVAGPSYWTHHENSDDHYYEDSDHPAYLMDDYERGSYRLPIYPRVGNLIAFTDTVQPTTCHGLSILEPVGTSYPYFPYGDTNKRYCNTQYHPYESGQRHATLARYDTSGNIQNIKPRVCALFIITSIEYYKYDEPYNAGAVGDPLHNGGLPGASNDDVLVLTSIMRRIKSMSMVCVWSDQSISVLNGTEGWCVGDTMTGEMLCNYRSDASVINPDVDSIFEPCTLQEAIEQDRTGNQLYIESYYGAHDASAFNANIINRA